MRPIVSLQSRHGCAPPATALWPEDCKHLLYLRNASGKSVISTDILIVLPLRFEMRSGSRVWIAPSANSALGTGKKAKIYKRAAWMHVDSV